MASVFWTDMENGTSADALDTFGESLSVSHRGNSQTFVGIVGLPDHELADEDGFRIESSENMIRFRTQDVTICVEAGAIITQTVAGKDVCFKVLAEAGQPAVEFVDPARLWTKCRVKRINVQDSL